MLTEITGGCYCGAIRYRADTEPKSQGMCHCANCRRAAGEPAVAWVTFKTDQVIFLQGEPTRYRAPNGAIWSFCSACGSTLAYENDHRKGEIDLTTGSLDDPERFPPKGESFEDEKLSWMGSWRQS